MNPSVRQHLARWFPDIHEVEATEHGLDASVYRIATGEGSFAIKYGTGPAILIEAHILRQLESVSVPTPNLHAFAIEPPVVVEPWVGGLRYDELNNDVKEVACAALGEALSTVHAAYSFDTCGNFRIDDAIDIGQTGWHPLSLGNESWKTFASDYATHVLSACPEWADDVGREMIAVIDNTDLEPANLSLAHGDIVQSNVRFDRDGAVHSLLDFGSSRVYPAAAEKWIVAERIRWVAHDEGLSSEKQHNAFINGYERGPTSTTEQDDERRAYRLIGILKAMRDAGVRSDRIERLQRSEQLAAATALLNSESSL